MGISLTIPLLWLPSFAWAQSSIAARQAKNFSSVALGSKDELTRMGVALAAFAMVTLLLNPVGASPDFFHTIIAAFQYGPTLLPLCWALPKKPSTTIPEADASSQVAIKIFSAIGIVSAAQYVGGFVFPLIFQQDSVQMTLPQLLFFVITKPTEHGVLMSWFLLGEWFSCIMSMCIFVGGEANVLQGRVGFSIWKYLLIGLVVGNGASLMVFAAWRERKLMDTMKRAMAGAKRE
ncbi:hypothetical protein HDU98_007056 [Podochytrium sp. JEL0797]|nr:hypothetical protein HDU98_007056 [Podochytrium sp. JEL0797]